MPTVTESVELPADVDATRTLVQVQLYKADRTPLKEARDSVSGDTIAGRRVVVLDGTTPESPSVGSWSLVLTGNANIVPSGTVWGRRLVGPQIDDTLSYATVAATGGPYQWQQILTDPPAALAPSGLSAHAADVLLHAGGQLIAYADRATSFTTSSTTAVDVTSVSVTFNVPTGPYVVEAGAFALFEEGRAGQIAVSSGSRTGGVVTLNTGTHGLVRDQVAQVAAADATYNGAYVVQSVPTTTQLTYNQTGLGNDAASGTGTVAPVGTPGAGGTIQITDGSNVIVGQDGGRAATGVDNDLQFLCRRTVVPNVQHAPAAGTPITYKLRALTSHASSDFSLIGAFFGFNDAPYIMAYKLRGL